MAKLSFEDYVKKYNIRDLDNPESFYDYRSAYKAGVIPTKWKDLPMEDREEDIAQGRNIQPEDYMWPDKFKLEGHPFPSKETSLINPGLRGAMELSEPKEKTDILNDRSANPSEPLINPKLKSMVTSGSESIDTKSVPSGHDKLTPVQQMYAIDAAEGTLNRVFTFFGATTTGVGTALTLINLGKKRYIQEMIGTGKLKGDELSLVQNAPDQEWQITFDPDFIKKFYEGESRGTTKNIMVSMNDPEFYRKLPAYAKVNIKKEYETRKTIAPIKTLAKFVTEQKTPALKIAAGAATLLGGPITPAVIYATGGMEHREKEVLKGAEVKYIKLGDMTIGDVQDWLEQGTNKKDIITASKDASIQALRGWKTTIPMTSEEKGKVITTPFQADLITGVKSNMPIAAPGRKLVTAGAVAAETLIPSPPEIVLYPAGLVLKGAIKPVSVIDDIAKAAGKAPGDLSLADTVIGLIKRTPSGEAIFRTLDNFAPTRLGLRWFGVMPKEASNLKQISQEIKAVTATSQRASGQMAIDLSEAMFEASKHIKRVVKEDIYIPTLDTAHKSLGFLKRHKTLYRAAEERINEDVAKYVHGLLGDSVKDFRALDEATIDPSVRMISSLYEMLGSKLRVDEIRKNGLRYFKNIKATGVSELGEAMSFGVKGADDPEAIVRMIEEIGKGSQLRKAVTDKIEWIKDIVDRLYKGDVRVAGEKTTLHAFVEDMDNGIYKFLKLENAPDKTIIDVANSVAKSVPTKLTKRVVENKIWNPKIFRRTLEHLEDWFYGRSKGNLYLKDFLDSGGTVDEFFNNTKELAKRIGVPEEYLTHFISVTDMRDIITAIEKGDNSLKKIIGEKAAAKLMEILQDNTALKSLAGMIPESAKAKYLSKQGLSTYFPRTSIARRVAKSKPYSITNFKPGWAKVRSAVNKTWRDFESAILGSATPELPEYNIFKALLLDSEEAHTFVMQHLIEKEMIASGTFRKLRLVNPVKEGQLGKAWGIVNKYRDHLSEIMRKKGAITDRNVVVVANNLLSDSERILSEFKAGVKSIPVINLRSVEANLKRRIYQPWEQRASFYFTKSRLRIFPTNFRKELEKAVSKGLKLSDDDVRTINNTLDQIRGIVGRGDELTGQDMDVIQQLLGQEIMKRAAPKTVFATTSKVPVHMVDSEVGKMIQSEVRTVSDPYVRPIMRFLRRIEQPFMMSVTSYNPNFWRKTMMTNIFQMWNGNVPFVKIPGRIIQGSLISTGMGVTDINGVKVPNALIRQAAQEAGVMVHIRSLLSAENFNAASAAFDDIFYHTVRGRKFLRLAKLPETGLAGADDWCRLGLFVNSLDNIARDEGLKSVDDILAKRHLSARHTWRFMFNYGDMPHALKSMKVAFPFLAWKYFIIPDQVKFLFRMDKMRKLAAGHMAIQNVLEPPHTPIAQDYIRRSPELKYERDGKVYRIITNLPYMNILDFKNYETYVGNMFASTQPLAQLSLSLAGISTYPNVQFYKDMSSEQAQVPMPLSMAMYWKTLLSNRQFNKMTNLQISIESNEDGESQPYLSVSKQYYDIWHQLFSPFIPLDENSKNLKLFVDEDNVQFLYNDPKDISELTSEIVKKSGVASFTIKKHPQVGYLESRPNAMIREVDVIGGWKRQYQKMVALEGELNGYRPYQIANSLQKAEVVNVYNKYEKTFYEFLKIKEQLLEYLEDDPEGFEEMKFDIKERVSRMEKHAQSMRQMIDVVNGD